MKQLTEPDNLSICVWYRIRELGSTFPVPMFAMVRIDEDAHPAGSPWFPVDAYHSDMKFLVKGLTWAEVLERTAGEDGPYLMPTYEELSK